MSEPLGFHAAELSEMPDPGGFQVSYFDLAGKMIINVLRFNVPQITSIDLVSDKSRVLFTTDTNKQPLLISFDRSRVNATNPQRLFVIMIMVSVAMTLVSYLFLRSQIRPIRLLARAAEAFGKGRRLPYKASGAHEIRLAGQAFIDMRDRFERQIEQRTLMLSGVSHDLRTPLTRLKLGLSLIDHDAETDALMRDVDDMEQMLDEFLSFSRGDSLEVTEVVNPLDLVEDVVKSARRGGQEISLDLPKLAAPVQKIALRPNAVRRALTNLVTNAQRYGSRCRVSVRLSDQEFAVSVEDNGPGIPAGLRDKALSPFERLDDARNQNRGTGVGLGLAIAKDVASSHGGSLDLADSTDLGGLKVTLSLPR
jgi:two-component system osmolarity sensor histidine kinase EnvZ